MIKINLDEEINKEEVSNEACKRLFSKLIIKHLIYSVFFCIVLVLSIIYNKRVGFFSKIISNININFFEIIYYLFLSLALAIHLSLGMFNLIRYLKIDKWYNLSYKIDKKTDLLSFIFSAISIMFFIMIFILTPCNVSGRSMNKTLNDKDKLIVSDLFYTPKHNDIVIFDASKYTNNSGELFIKRVVAIKGDVISYNNKTQELFINDKFEEYFELHQFTFLAYQLDIEVNDYSFVIPDGYLMVLGDNRSNSVDSRYFGLIEESQVYGRVLFRIYPFKKIEEEIVR